MTLTDEQLIEVTTEAVKVTRSKIKYSSTGPKNLTEELSLEKRLLLAKAIELEMRLSSDLNEISKFSKAELEEFSIFHYFLQYKRSTKMQFGDFKGIGNCFEFALATYLYLQKRYGHLLADTPMEFIKVGKDHIVLVIGRNKQSSLNNINLWDTKQNHAIICDPLLNSVFYAKDWQGNLKEYAQYDGKNGNFYNPVENTEDIFTSIHLTSKNFLYLDVIKIKIKLLLCNLFVSEYGKINDLEKLFKYIDECKTIDDLKLKGIPNIINNLYPPNIEGYELIAKVMREKTRQKLDQMLSHVNDSRIQTKRFAP